LTELLCRVQFCLCRVQQALGKPSSCCSDSLFTIAPSSSLDNRDRCLIQEVPLKITCKNELVIFLLNTASFLFNHIA
jgi:hypothetical protein